MKTTPTPAPTAHELEARRRGWKIDRHGTRLYWVARAGRWVSVPEAESKDAPERFHLARPKVRFNWGYWDGKINAARGWERADGLTVETILQDGPDPFYAHGYVLGDRDQRAMDLKPTSTPAWNEFRSVLRDPALIHAIEAAGDL